MTRSVEIPEESVQKAARLLFDAEWREGDWYWEQYPEPNRWQLLARQLLEAALPYLAPAEGGLLEEHRCTDLNPHKPHTWMHEASAFVCDGGALAVPQSVDREALTRMLTETVFHCSDNEEFGLSAKHASAVSDAVVALLAGEEGVRYCSDVAVELGLNVEKGYLPRECCDSCHDDFGEGYEDLIWLDENTQVCCAIARLAEEALAGEQEQVEK